jgi:flagellar protein FliS
MNAVMERAASTYAKLDVEAGVLGASPQVLIVMLYDGAIRAILSARAALEAKDHATKGPALSKAIGIIDEGLKPALDLEAGGEIAANLAALYEYMTRKLMLANLRNDLGALDEVVRLLQELKSAWESLVSRPAGRSPDEGAGAQGRTGSLSYGKA